MDRKERQKFFSTVKSGKTNWVTTIIFLSLYLGISILGLLSVFASSENGNLVRGFAVADIIIASVALWGFTSGKKFSYIVNYILGFLIVVNGNMTGQVLISSLIGFGIIFPTYTFAKLERKFKTNALSPNEKK